MDSKLYYNDLNLGENMDLEVRKRNSRGLLIIYSIFFISSIALIIGVVMAIMSHTYKAKELAYYIFVAISFSVIFDLLFIMGLNEYISSRNPKLYDAYLIASTYIPHYTNFRGGERVDALIHRFRIIDSNQIVSVEELKIKEENRKRSICFDGTDIITLYSFKELKKLQYDIKDHSQIKKLADKYR